MPERSIIDPTSQILLKEGLRQTEEDLKAGLLTADVAVDSLAEFDVYYMSARQASGERVTGAVFRTRVRPHAYFMIPGLVVLGAATARILEDRLPPAPVPTPKLAVGPMDATPTSAQISAKHAVAAAVAASPAAKAKARTVARAGKIPPGALDPASLTPPSLEGDERVPQG